VCFSLGKKKPKTFAFPGRNVHPGGFETPGHDVYVSYSLPAELRFAGLKYGKKQSVQIRFLLSLCYFISPISVSSVYKHFLFYRDFVLLNYLL
jgi:hypothetical protein